MIRLSSFVGSIGSRDGKSSLSGLLNFSSHRPKWRLEELSILYLLVVYPVICMSMFTPGVVGNHDSYRLERSVPSANIKLIYNNSKGELEEEVAPDGYFGLNSHIASARGILVQVRTTYNKSGGNNTYGCSDIEPSIVPKRKWIAFVERGLCKFNDKIYFAGKKSNASAVVVYNNKEVEDDNHEEEPVIKVEGVHDVEKVVAVYIKDYKRGKKIVELLNNGVEVIMEISVGIPITSSTPPNNGQLNPNNTSVLFVSISFIVLIIISLAWLVFYYIQRCRYSNAKERLNRTLANAAKKAIAKIPQRSVKLGDKELDPDADQCAVCIEPYKLSDVIRILPCKHVFHKPCVDPWLLDQRSCPMCKLDILKAFGMLMNGSQESVPQDQESGLLTSSPAIEDTEHLSNSEEQGAVGGVKIVLYQREAVPYHDSDDPDFSSEVSLDCAPGTSRTAQCRIECTDESLLEHEHLRNQLSLAPSNSMESIHSLDSECNEKQSLMTGLLVEEGSTSIPRCKSHGSGSLSQSTHDFE